MHIRSDIKLFVVLRIRLVKPARNDQTFDLNTLLVHHMAISLYVRSPHLYIVQLPGTEKTKDVQIRNSTCCEKREAISWNILNSLP